MLGWTTVRFRLDIFWPLSRQYFSLIKKWLWNWICTFSNSFILLRGLWLDSPSDISTSGQPLLAGCHFLSPWPNLLRSVGDAAGILLPSSVLRSSDLGVTRMEGFGEELFYICQYWRYFAQTRVEMEKKCRWIWGCKYVIICVRSGSWVFNKKLNDITCKAA